MHTCSQPALDMAVTPMAGSAGVAVQSQQRKKASGVQSHRTQVSLGSKQVCDVWDESARVLRAGVSRAGTWASLQHWHRGEVDAVGAVRSGRRGWGDAVA